MPETGLRLEISDGVAHLTFTEAARGNPIDGPLCASLSETAIQVSENRGIRCVLLAAEGKAFSYGGDVGAFVTDLDNLAHNIKRWTTTLHSAIACFQRMDAPVVAAVHGVCAGGMAMLSAIAAERPTLMTLTPLCCRSCSITRMPRRPIPRRAPGPALRARRQAQRSAGARIVGRQPIDVVPGRT